MRKVIEWTWTGSGGGICAECGRDTVCQDYESEGGTVGWSACDACIASIERDKTPGNEIVAIAREALFKNGGVYPRRKAISDFIRMIADQHDAADSAAERGEDPQAAADAVAAQYAASAEKTPF